MAIAPVISTATAASARSAPVARLSLELKAFANGQLRQAEAFLACDGESLHAGIHQSRKSIRRVRAILALGRKALGDRAKRLDDDLGRLCRGLSRLRDAQALIEALRRLDANAPEEVRAVLAAAEARARLRRDQMLAVELLRDPQLASRRSRLLAYSRRLERLEWQALDEGRVSAAIERSEHRAEKAGQRSFRHPDRDADWHVYRRRLRRLRQQDTLLAELRPELRPTIQGLEERATLLGEAQDDALLIRHCRRGSPFQPGPRALLRNLARDRLNSARRLP